MSETERKLATILAMDVVDYSAKMSQNEETTLQSLRQCREIIEQVVSSQKGRIFNTAGDAFMIEFASPVAAVTSAVNIQKEIKDRNYKLSAEEHLEFRMGVNMGDIMIEGENLFGEGVNVAARLEGIAPAGGICISEIIHSVVKGKVAVEFVDQGPQELKNIDEPVRAYYADLEPGGAKPKRSRPSKGSNSLFEMRWVAVGVALVAVVLAAYFGGQMPETKEEATLNTILVLPLENMGGDETSNFATGLSQDLVNGLSRAAKSLNVIALGQKPEDLEQTVEKTGASYIISGSLRQSGDSIRLSVSLINANNMATAWTENFDETMSAGNIFSLQDTIVEGVVNELVGGGEVLTRDIVKRLENRGTDNMSAYECVNYVRGVHLTALSPATHEKAKTCLREAVEQDPNYADAWVLLASEIGNGYALFGTASLDDLSEALGMLRKAITIDPKLADAYTTRSQIYFYQKDWSEMFKADEQAYSLSPNRVRVAGTMAQNFLWGGNCTREQIMDFEAAPGTYMEGDCRWQRGLAAGFQAHKLDSGNIWPNENYALACHHVVKQDFDKTLYFMELTPAPGFLWWDIYVGTSHDGLGNETKAKERFESIKTGLGSNKLSDVKTHFGFWNIIETYYPSFEPILIKYGFE